MASVTQAEVCNLISWACRVAERGEFYISKKHSFGRVLFVHVGFNWAQRAATWNYEALFEKLLDV